MSRSLLIGAAVAALVALSAFPAVGAAAPARAAAATCPGTFTVLHNDHIGSVAFPAGQYRVATNQLSCATASQLFARFLQDYDGVLPAPWQLIGNIRRFQKVGTASEFQVTPIATPKPSPSSLACPGTFTVLHNDHIGAMSVPAGRWQITLLSSKGLSCAQASSQLATFLAYDWSGRLPKPWTMNVATRTFQTSPTNGFRITYKGSGTGGGGHHPDTHQVRCPTFRVLNTDRIGALVLPKGTYIMWAWGSVSCKQASADFRAFLNDPSGELPPQWVEIPQTGSFVRGASGFRVKPVS